MSMQPIGSLFKERKVEIDRRTEYGELLKTFVSRINAGRAGTKFKPITIPRIARLVQGMSVSDLYYLKRVCEDSKNYSARFFYEINPKKHAA